MIKNNIKGEVNKMQYTFKCKECNKVFDHIVSCGTESTNCTCGELADRDHTPTVPNFVLIGHTWSHTGYEGREQHKQINKIRYANQETTTISEAMKDES